MEKTITPTQFRKELYARLDAALEEKETVIIKRKKRNIKLVPLTEESRFSRLISRNITRGSSDDLASFSPAQWTEAKNL
jgi:hypothetical protein